MIETILMIIAALLFLSVLVVSHEFGHFIVGKKCGIGIVEFSVGFGPKLLSKVRKGIRYSVRLLPLGGFVQFVGEDEEIENDPRAFNSRPIWQRFLTILAGPVMNIIFALLTTMIVLVGFGEGAAYIDGVRPGSYAEELGLARGDRIAAVNGDVIDFSMEFSESELSSGFSAEAGDTVELTIVNSEKQTKTVVLQLSEDEHGLRVPDGISYGVYRRTFGLFEGLSLSFKWMYLIIAELLSALGGLIFGGQGLEQLGGIVYTVKIISDVMRTNAENIFRLASILSINLAIINILPLPALDGGRLVFLAIEKVTHRAVSRKVEGIVNIVGLGLLLALSAVLIFKDISRLAG